MNTLWTPSGERPIKRTPDASSAPTSQPPKEAANQEESFDSSDLNEADLSPQDRAMLEAQMREAQQKLLSTPPEAIIANHCYGLFELAAMYLSTTPPHIDGARLAIDALGSLVDGVGTRLGTSGSDMSEALSQLKMAFVEIQSAPAAGPSAGPN